MVSGCDERSDEAISYRGEIATPSGVTITVTITISLVFVGNLERGRKIPGRTLHETGQGLFGPDSD